jgi:hypothetical protein
MFLALMVVVLSMPNTPCIAQGGMGVTRVASWLSLSETARQLFGHLFTPTVSDQIKAIAEKYPGGSKFVIQVTATGFGNKPDFDRMVRYGTQMPFFGQMLFYDKIYIRDAGPAQNWPDILADNVPCRFSNIVYPSPAYNEHVVDTVFIRLEGIAKALAIVTQLKILGPTPLVAYRNEPLQLRLYGYQTDGWQGEMFPTSAKWTILSKVTMLNARGSTEYKSPGIITDGRLLVTADVGSVEIEARIGNVFDRKIIPVARKESPPERLTGEKMELDKAIRSSGDKWSKHFCEPSKKIQYCNFHPMRAVEDLLFRLNNGPPTREHLDGIKHMLTCYDSCMMKMPIQEVDRCKAGCVTQQKPTGSTGFGR